MWGGLTDEMEEALLSKPRVEVHNEYPYSSIPMEGISGSEVILYNTVTEGYYYVNTEGYEYPRYIFEIVNFPNN